MLNKNRLVNNPGAALAILFGSFFFFMCVFSLLSGLIMPRISNPTVALRILTLLQAIFLFIVPALLMSVTASKLPATLLAVDRRPRLLPTLFIIITLIVAIPAMNYIIEWNNNIKLPESLHDLELSIRQLEDAAQEATNTILGGHTVGSLIVSILIVGVMAGFSEELFFRGALQRTLGSTKLNKNTAVIIAALVFSFMHFQFYGFIPRFLLGLFFGYILVWSDCLWYAIIAHACNNIMAVTVTWLNGSTNANLNLDTVGQTTDNTLPHMPIVIMSIIVTTLSITILQRYLKNDIKKLQ